MLATVLADRMTEQATLALPSPSDILYPDFFSPTTKELGSASSETFAIDSVARADWAIARIIEAQARMATRADLAADLHCRVNSWLAKANTSDEDSVSYLMALLRPYAEAEIATQHRSRSLILPSGTASLRRLPDRLEITDAKAAMAWAEDTHPEAIVTKKELSKSALKTLIFTKGEAVPGVDACLGSDELYIRARALKD